VTDLFLFSFVLFCFVCLMTRQGEGLVEVLRGCEDQMRYHRFVVMGKKTEHLEPRATLWCQTQPPPPSFTLSAVVVVVHTTHRTVAAAVARSALAPRWLTTV
jgi:hypothetical protein